MTAIADRRGESPGPEKGPGTARVKAGIEIRFYAGLIALTLLLIFGTLAIIAVLPIAIPGFTSATITSGSMLPNLRPGDVVIASANAEVQVNSIVVYEDPRRHDLVTHRVVRINSNGSYLTKGDANGTDDRTSIPPTFIRGVGRWVVPYVGLPRVWFNNGQWLHLVVTLVAVGLVIWLARYALDSRFDPWAAPTLVAEPR